MTPQQKYVQEFADLLTGLNLNLTAEQTQAIQQGLSKLMQQVSQNNSITQREYFASNAPEMPDWFPLPEIKYKTPNPPSWINLHTEEHRQLAKGWINNPVFDLPEELKFFQDKWEARWKECRELDHSEKVEQFFYWRIYYADQLIAALNKTPTHEHRQN